MKGGPTLLGAKNAAFKVTYEKAMVRATTAHTPDLEILLITALSFLLTNVVNLLLLKSIQRRRNHYLFDKRVSYNIFSLGTVQISKPVLCSPEIMPSR